MKIGICSDIHAHRYDQTAQVQELIQHINTQADLDIFIFGGDLSHHTQEIRQFLESITLTCPKLWIPGNHDIWVIEQESEQDSSDYRYHELFPQMSMEVGWHYLPSSSFVDESTNTKIIGTIGWFSGTGFSEWFDCDADERNEQIAIQCALHVENELKSTDAQQKVILAIHHVPHTDCIPLEVKPNGRVNEHIQSVIQKSNHSIELVVHGHYHNRYPVKTINGVKYIAHPFGYPHQHKSVEDGFVCVEL